MVASYTEFDAVSLFEVALYTMPDCSAITEHVIME